MVNRKNQEQMALKEVLQDSKYKNRELSIISQLDHPNVIEMKDYFFTMNDGKCVLHILMDYMDTSLHNLLKHHRPSKLPLPLPHRKIIAFQLFKGLYYLAVNLNLLRQTTSAIVISSLPTFCSTRKRSNSRSVILGRPKS